MKRLAILLALVAGMSGLPGCAFVQTHPALIVIAASAVLVASESDEHHPANQPNVPTPTINPCPTPASCQ